MTMELKEGYSAKIVKAQGVLGEFHPENVIVVKDNTESWPQHVLNVEDQGKLG